MCKCKSAKSSMSTKSEEQQTRRPSRPSDQETYQTIRPSDLADQETYQTSRQILGTNAYTVLVKPLISGSCAIFIFVRL
jgi:hypothetical protein